MHLLKKIYLFILLTQAACGSGGPLTPVESFNGIRHAVEKNDSDVIVNYLTQSSLDKISKHNQMIRGMRSDQLAMLSVKYGYPQDKLLNMKTSDAVSLYFFSDAADIKLGRYFRENIVSIDIDGKLAFVKTESGIELDFIREGPYWKFDLSNL